MKLPLLALVFLTLVSACATPPPAQMKTRFNPDEHVDYAVQGSASVKGQAFLRQRGGGVVTCAGSEVLLFPATAYFKELMQNRLSGRRVDIVVSPLQRTIVKKGQCDANGNFAFDSLAAGPWLVVTQVTWMAGRNEQGGYQIKQVTLVQGQSVQVLLSENELVN